MSVLLVPTLNSIVLVLLVLKSKSAALVLLV